MVNISKGLKYVVFTLIVLLFTSGTATSSVESRFGYEYDVVGNTPLDSKLVTEGLNTSIRVSANWSSNGNNSLHINDYNATTGKAQYDVQSSANTSKIVNGSIRYFVNFTNNQESYFITYNNAYGLIGLTIKYSAGVISYYNGTAYNVLGSYSTNTSNNVTIAFNSGNKTFDYYLNGTYLNNGTYREAAGSVQILRFETLASGTPSFYIDNIRTIDSDTPSEVRPFPYPYRAAWTLSSDIDDTDWIEFFDIYDFMNTNKNISGLGVGVDLDVSSNFWMQGDTVAGGGKSAGCYYYQDFVTTTLCENSSISIDYMKSGHLDVAHNWASTAFNMSVAGDVSWLLDLFSVLKSNDINLTVWLNHGGTDMITNIGTQNAAWAGDNATNASAYHLNKTMANQSIHYYWESDPASSVSGSYVSTLLVPTVMDDSSKLFMFYRVKGGFSGTPYNRNFSTQINSTNIDELIRKSGYAIEYTHLGYNGSGDFVHMSPVFDAAAIQGLNNISDYNHGTDGKPQRLYVTTVAKMLRYAEVTGYLNYTYNSTLGTLVIHSVNSSVRNFTPTTTDLEGATFLVPTTTNIFIGGTNVTSSTVANTADENGEVSIMFPISRLSYPYPEISSVGSYNISSTGVVLWNRNTTRPTISQRINFTISASSGDVRFTSVTWNKTGDYRKVFNLSASASVTMGNFAPNTNYWLNRNGVQWTVAKSNSSGYISFTDTILAETQYSTSSATAQDSYKTSTCQSTLNWGVVGSALVIILIIIGAGTLAIGFLTSVKFDTVPIEQFVLALIGVVVVGSIGVAIISPIITLVGCP